MSGFLRGLACFAGIAIFWTACQVNLALSLVLLLLFLGATIWLLLTNHAKNNDDHLYDEPPTLRPIRGPQTPQRYDFEGSNLDAPFFDLESKNYGKITPRKHVRGIPIDRFLEFQEKVDSLSEQLTSLLEKIQEPSTTAPESKTAQKSSDTSESTTYAEAPNQRKRTKPRFKNDSKTAKPSTYPAFTPPTEDKGILRRFKKSRAGDPWDSSSHWGWKN